MRLHPPIYMEDNMTITLKNAFLTVQFSNFGGSLTSIKDRDSLEYLWQGDPDYWSGQAPVLFPICGSLRNDLAVYRQKEEGRIPRHGLVRKETFLLEKEETDRVVFSIRSDQDMYANYPYHFELKLVYTLIGSTIRTEYQVTNLEPEKTMPYFIGGHPGFNCPLFGGERYEDYYLEFEKEETCTVPRSFPKTGLLDLADRALFLDRQKRLDLDYSLFSHDAITLDKLVSKSVSLKSKKHSKGLRLDFADFPNLILWSTVNKSPFIALEPWSGLSTSLGESDYFEDKGQVTYVESGQTSRKQFEITIL